MRVINLFLQCSVDCCNQAQVSIDYKFHSGKRMLSFVSVDMLSAPSFKRHWCSVPNEVNGLTITGLTFEEGFGEENLRLGL
jgi:hypothetical protein